MSNFDTQLQFFLKILDVTIESQGSPQAIYPILEENVSLLDDGFANVLRKYTFHAFQKLELLHCRYLLSNIIQISDLISAFPQGNQDDNTEIAIAGYETVLELVMQEPFPDLTAAIYSGLGNLYGKRLNGNPADNIEQQILYYQKALEALTTGHFRELRNEILNNLGMAYLERQQGEASKNIIQAIQCFHEILQNYTSQEDQIVASHNLSLALPRQRSPELQKAIQQAEQKHQEYLQNKQIHLLDESITLWKTALMHPKFEHLPQEFFWVCHNNSALACYERYCATRDIQDLEFALSHWRKIVSQVSSEWENYPILLYNLGAGFRHYYDHTENPQHLDDAIVYLQKAVQITPKDPTPLYNLATALHARYVRNGSLADLKEAKQSSQYAVDLARSIPSETPNLPKYLCELGYALRSHYERTVDEALVQQMIEVGEEAVKTARQYAPEKLAQALVDFGTGLRHRYWWTKNPDDIQKAIEAFEKSVNLTPEDSPDAHVFLNHLGKGFQCRYFLSKDLADLNASVNIFRRTINTAPRYLASNVAYLINLGIALIDLYNDDHDPRHKQEAISIFQKASQRGVELSAGEGLRGAKLWLEWAFQRQSWDEVEEAYTYVSQISERLVQIQLLRQDKESWLRSLQGMAAQAAYACAKNGKLQKAVITLERDLARLLSDSLAIDRASLAQLKNTEHAGLYEAYQHAVNQWQLKTQQAYQTEQYYFELRAAHRAFDEAVSNIRQISGYENFLAAPKFEDIHQAVKQHESFVYILPTDKGGLALIVRESVRAVWLPELTTPALQNILVGHNGDSEKSYLHCYINWRGNPQNTLAREAWHEALSKTTSWLWQTIMQPLLNALPTPNKAILIPVSHLKVLPFHAAWIHDKVMPTGKRYALDEFTFLYTPNAHTLQEVRKIAKHVSSDSILVIDDPQPVKAHCLPNSEYEVRTILSMHDSSHSQIFRHEEATRDAILHTIKNHAFLHFSCHGRADFGDPLNSYLLMANDEFLKLKDLLDLRLDGVRLVTLSACETGIPGIKLVDEVINLPSGLLQAGVAGIVASLWSVSDLSTMMLMTKFYDLCWREEIEPPEALRLAQIWLRDSTNQEKLDYFQSEELPIHIRNPEVAHKLIDTLEDRLGFAPENRDFAHPFYWAAFQYVGV